MKKILLTLLALAASVCCALGVSACNLAGNGGDSGSGNDKKQSEWGTVYTKAAAYQKAKDLGYEGTLEEFIASISGKDGADGKDGVNGTNGVDGKDGTNGTDGVGIKDIDLNSDGEIVVTLTDDSSVTVGVPHCNHDYSAWSTVHEATCTSIGVKERECTLCGATDYEFIEALDHIWDGGFVVQSATCVQEGLIIYGCETCGAAKRVILESLGDEGHEYNSQGVCIHCGYENPSLTFDIVFNFNYPGATYITSKVIRGQAVDFPEDPVRDGYILRGWALNRDAKPEQVVSDRYVPDGNVIFYAVWVDNRDYTVNFRYNYSDAPSEAYYSATAKSGEKIAAPAAPTRTGFTFKGWSKNKYGGTLINPEAEITVEYNSNYYAQWESDPVVSDIFDAEFCPIDPNHTPPGYSGCVTNGYNIILIDSDNFGATTQHTAGSPFADESYYVSYMYEKDFTLTFKINSEADTNGKLVLRAAGEAIFLNYGNIEGAATFTSADGDMCVKILVNDVELNYGSFTVEADKFKDFTLGNIHLNEGENVIKLVISNNTLFGGVAKAAAPIVDCIKITDHGEAVLSWSPEYDNLANR